LREAALRHLACPSCRGDLKLGAIEKRTGDSIEQGNLLCTICQKSYPIVRRIPRFVSIENYAVNFGYQWTKHARTQYDSYTGLKLSEKRFFEETLWPRNLAGEIILEAGSGSGRYTEQAASTNAFVVSFDYSNAVEANYASNGFRDNVLIVQADIFHMPFRAGYFDKVFCFGVLQHTPDVRGAFHSLPPVLKPGGDLVIDVYRRTKFHTKYIIREFTVRIFRQMDPKNAYRLTQKWIDLLWPYSRLIGKLPRYGLKLNWLLIVPDYSRQGLSGKVLKEWAYLDAFDMLAPSYDSPQTLQRVNEWFSDAKMTNVVVKYGYNGIEGRGKKSA
jgi:SAM-dependent methyltransferase